MATLKDFGVNGKKARKGPKKAPSRKPKAKTPAKPRKASKRGPGRPPMATQTRTARQRANKKNFDEMRKAWGDRFITVNFRGRKVELMRDQALMIQTATRDQPTKKGREGIDNTPPNRRTGRFSRYVKFYTIPHYVPDTSSKKGYKRAGSRTYEVNYLIHNRDIPGTSVRVGDHKRKWPKPGQGRPPG